jgi:CHASE2 domain-containing sensor protein
VKGWTPVARWLRHLGAWLRRLGAWLRREVPADPSMDPVSHLTHHLGYEVSQAMVVAVVLACLAFAGLGGRFADLYVWLRGSAPVSDQVTLLSIGDEALYLWDPADPAPEVTPRALLAELVRFGDAAGARVIVLDILLDRPAGGDVALASAAEAHGAVIGAERFAVTDPGAGREFAAGITPALAGSVGAGFANLHEEERSLFSGSLLARKAPLVRRLARATLTGPYPTNLVGGEQTDGEVRPSLALLAAWLQAGGHPASHVDQLIAQLHAGCTGRPLACGIGGSELGLPGLPAGLEEPLAINFRGREHGDPITTVRAAEALRVMGQDALMRSLGVEAPVEVPTELAEALRDRVVVVCRVDTAAADRFVTPYAFPMMLREDMAGGRIQAQLIDTLLSGRHLRSLGAWAPWTLAVLLVGGIWLSRARIRDDIHSVVWIGAGMALIAAGAALFVFTDGVVLELGVPLSAGLLALIALRLQGWAREG